MNRIRFVNGFRNCCDTVISSIEHLENTPDINDFHQNAIQNVLQQYENLLRLSPHDRSLVFDVRRTYARMGKVARLRFSRDEGLHYGRRGRELLESLKKDDPHNSRLLRELAEAQFWVGIEGSDGRALKSSIQSFTEVATLEPEDVSHATHLAVAREFYAEEFAAARRANVGGASNRNVARASAKFGLASPIISMRWAMSRGCCHRRLNCGAIWDTSIEPNKKSLRLWPSVAWRHLNAMAVREVASRRQVRG